VRAWQACAVTGMQHLEAALHVDQARSGGRRGRTGAYTEGVRPPSGSFSRRPRGQGPRYSRAGFLHVKGGRCAACAGDGHIKIEMQFGRCVAAIARCATAPVQTDTLAVHDKGRHRRPAPPPPPPPPPPNPPPCRHASRKQPGSSRPFRDPPANWPPVEVGWASPARPAAPDPVRREAQRVKASVRAAARSTGRTIYVIEEPTTGCTSNDIRKMSRCFFFLLGRRVGRGNNVIVMSTTRRDQDRRMGHRPRTRRADPAARSHRRRTPEHIAQSTTASHRPVLKKI